MVKVNYKKKIRLGKTQQKIVLLLLAGLSMGLSTNPKKHFDILGELHDELKNFDSRHLKKSIKSLYESNVVKVKENKDGTMTLVLSEEGKKRAVSFNINNIEIKKPNKWDGKWRFILFDVPERKRYIRNGLRFHLKTIGFFEYQKSVFTHPYDCKDEIDYIIEFYEAREFVRYVVAEGVDNELHLKTFFNI
jgi:DNA-binding transcriptional regulator PaaX